MWSGGLAEVSSAPQAVYHMLHMRMCTVYGYEYIMYMDIPYIIYSVLQV